jgi:hypothetical protein
MPYKTDSQAEEPSGGRGVIGLRAKRKQLIIRDDVWTKKEK